MKRLYLIHHSHTDVGYTALQSRVERWHCDFIRQALGILAASRSRETADFDGFKWVCETFWAVERFLEEASEDERRRFVAAVQAGRIGVSGSYLNLNELLDADLLHRVLARAAHFAAEVGVRIDSAMTADINGSSWGFAQALHDHGIENLFTCIHTHHGMYPLTRPQVPFWWETPRGQHLLVWSGEHYHFGNELGVVPGAVSSYLTKDECDAAMIFSDSWRVAEIRLPRYFERLNQAGYPYDFVPVMASGLRSDNAPPNAAIIDFITRWNQTHGHEIRVSMVTLSEFFRELREQAAPIAVHRGDWPDWWSDGPASNPRSTKIFRQAQRDLQLLRHLWERSPTARPANNRLESLERELALYAEHTFSHADSMSQPWHLQVQTISARKGAYAASAYDEVQRMQEDALWHLGGTRLSPGMSLRYRILNPLARRVSGVVRLVIHGFEYHELGFERGAEVIDLARQERRCCQEETVPGGAAFCVHVVLEPGEERILELRPAERRRGEARAQSPGGLTTPHVQIAWEVGGGLVEWRDRQSRRSLLRDDRRHAPLVPIYERTPVPDRARICQVRGAMLLNRKGADVERSVGRLQAARIVAEGEVFVVARLDYECPGVSDCSVELHAFMQEPRVDVSLRMHKESVWEPENLYLALPFAVEDAELWLDKAGAAVRPRLDQIPGSLTDFYSIQEGLAWVAPRRGMILATPDSHLVQLGPLEHGERLLAGDPRLASDPGHVYAWLMTNYWETNFEASLGGFHEFRFSLKWGDGLNEPATALQACRDLTQGILCFRMRG